MKSILGKGTRVSSDWTDVMQRKEPKKNERYILLDSGADAAIFPENYAIADTACWPDLQLYDLQGRRMPVMGMGDHEGPSLR